MIVRSEIVYRGDLHCEARHGPSGATIETDAPVDNHGKGEAFSPTDLVGASMATCMVTIMGIAAQKHELDIEGTSASVEKSMVADPHRRIARLAVTIRVPKPVPLEMRPLLERAALSCPVRRSLRDEVEAPLSFEWSG
jgi:putative redox protein